MSGGSTLTMQVVRLSRKGRPRTLVEKAIEAVLALRLTLSLSKEQVLGLYAAYAPFGGNTVGLDAAAWRYFGRDARQLSWAETATLAVLPNAPSLVHPGRNRDLLLAKRNRLLDALRERGAIDAMTADLAKREPLPPAPAPLPMLAPHLVARLRGEPRAGRFRAGDASPWVRTTLRKPLQERVGEIVARHRRVLGENGVWNAAALVLDVPTGEVLAYVGNHWPPGPDEHGEHVDVVPAPRSTGSVLKPFLYASMLEAGEVLPAAARPRRAHPHRLLPPRELRPGLRGGRPRRAGTRPLAERPRRPDAAGPRRRSLLCRAAAARDHDPHPAGRPLRPRPHPRRGGGDALGRDRRLRGPRALGPRGHGRRRAAGLLRAVILRERRRPGPEGSAAAPPPRAI